MGVNRVLCLVAWLRFTNLCLKLISYVLSIAFKDHSPIRTLPLYPRHFRMEDVLFGTFALM